MSKNPLVSVFIPYYNDKDFLRDAIEAVLGQSYENWELFLFDHASSDGSKEIALSYKDKRIHQVGTDENLGAGSGLNLKKTLPLMRGKYVKLLCADDILKPDGLKILVEYMEQNPDKDFVCADMDYISEDKEDLHTKWSVEIPKVDFVSDEKQTLLKFFQGYSHIAYPAAMVKKTLFDKVNLDVSFVMLFDVSLWTQALIAGLKIGFVDKSVVNYRISPRQLSSVKNKKAGKMGYFELYQLLDIWYKIKDVELISYLCAGKYANLLKAGDEEFIAFVLSHFFASVLTDSHLDFFKDQQDVREMFGCIKLHQILSDDEMREKIKNKFGFGIKEFREIYGFMPDRQDTKSVCSWKSRIYSNSSKNLTLKQLLFLLARKFYYTLFPFFKKHKKHKTRYTV